MLSFGSKALIVVTSQAKLGTTGELTGYYLPEVTHPYSVLQTVGIEIDIASVRGGEAPLDPNSLDLGDPRTRELWDTPSFRDKLKHTRALAEIEADEYCAIIYAGGHGTMWDFRENREVQRVTKKIWDHGGIVAAVCHGPAALVDVMLEPGMPLIRGKEIAGTSNEEEVASGKADVVPFLLESALRERGAIYSCAAPRHAHVVEDGRLITGQNPASALPLAEALVEALKRIGRIEKRSH